MALTDGLIEWIDFSSANAQHAGSVFTENGTPSYVADGVDLLQADDDWFVILNAAAGKWQMGTQDITFAGWAEVDSGLGLGGSYGAVFTFGGTGGATPGYHVAIRSTNRLYGWISDGLGNRLSANKTGFTFGTPHFMVVTYDRDGNITVNFDDGTPVTGSIATLDGIDIQATTDFFIANGYVAKPNVTYGSFGWWSRVLSSAEQTELYNSGSRLTYSDIAPAGSIIPADQLSFPYNYKY